MILKVFREGDILFQSDRILDFNVDGISLSSVEYWSQESRRASVKLLYTSDLKLILEGSSREVKAGFHTLNFVLEHDSQPIFAGVMAAGGYAIDYYSLTDKSIELSLMDYFGLLITLAADREHQLGALTNPIQEIPAIIHSCFTAQTKEERDNSTPAEVVRLIESLSCLSYLNAHLSYNAEAWLPWSVVDYEIYDYMSDMISGSFTTNNPKFGLRMIDGRLCIYFQDYFHMHMGHSGFYWNGAMYNDLEILRKRIYALHQDQKELIISADYFSTDQNPVDVPNQEFPEDLLQIYWGVNNYRLSGSKVLYSGSISINTVETVPGWYNAKNLLAEFLRLSHAVLLNFSGDFKVMNRIDDDRPKFTLFDPIEARYEEGEPPAKPQSSAVAVASLAMLEATDNYYNAYLKTRNLLHEGTVTLSDVQLPTLQPMLDSNTPPTNPYELINCNLIFDERLIHPREVDYDITTGLITVRGWC